MSTAEFGKRTRAKRPTCQLRELYQRERHRHGFYNAVTDPEPVRPCALCDVGGGVTLVLTDVDSVAAELTGSTASATAGGRGGAAQDAAGDDEGTSTGNCSVRFASTRSG